MGVLEGANTPGQPNNFSWLSVTITNTGQIDSNKILFCPVHKLKQRELQVAGSFSRLPAVPE